MTKNNMGVDPNDDYGVNGRKRCYEKIGNWVTCSSW